MKFASFTFATGNVGDDVQALAAALFANRLDAFVFRDALADAALDEAHACIFNCWFLSGRDYRPPAPEIRPIIHGMSITRADFLESPWRDYLIEHGPVGARDLSTLELLRANGVDAFWSGCMTTFMGARLLHAEERDAALIIDIDEETERKFVPPEISAKAERLSNFLPPSIIDDPFERLAFAMRLIAKIAKARLVVTRRLHAALPCVGLGTPVCVLPDPNISMARWRFAGYERWLPLCFKDDAATTLRFDWTLPTVASPPIELVDAHEKLLSTLSRLEIAGSERIDPAARMPRALRIAEHGLGRKKGRAVLRFGGVSRELTVKEWTPQEVIVATPALPLFSKLVGSIELTAGDGGSVFCFPLSSAMIE